VPRERCGRSGVPAQTRDLRHLASLGRSSLGPKQRAMCGGGGSLGFQNTVLSTVARELVPRSAKPEKPDLFSKKDDWLGWPLCMREAASAVARRDTKFAGAPRAVCTPWHSKRRCPLNSHCLPAAMTLQRFLRTRCADDLRSAVKARLTVALWYRPAPRQVRLEQWVHAPIVRRGSRTNDRPKRNATNCTHT